MSHLVHNFVIFRFLIIIAVDDFKGVSIDFKGRAFGINDLLEFSDLIGQLVQVSSVYLLFFLVLHLLETEHFDNSVQFLV